MKKKRYKYLQLLDWQSRLAWVEAEVVVGEQGIEGGWRGDGEGVEERNLIISL